MGIPIKSIGAKVSYAIETAIGTKPATGYAVIPDITNFPEYSPKPKVEQYETIGDTVSDHNVVLNKQLGSELAIEALLSAEFISAWNGFCTAFEAVNAEGKKAWLCVDVPGVSGAWFYRVEPVAAGVPAVAPNTTMKHNVTIVPHALPEFSETKPTYAAQA